MYFRNRAEAGRLLANKLKQYSAQQVAVVALNPGGVIVGAQIAIRLHANLAILMSERIMLPGEPDAVAAMTPTTFTYNDKYAEGELEDLVGEYHGMIEDQRLQKLYSLNRLMSDGGEIDPKYLRNHIVILVSDSLDSALPLQIAGDYLKSLKLKKLIIATPLASITAVDKMHLMGDEIYCLSVMENLMEVDHYYDENTLPDNAGILKITRNIAVSWQTA